MSDKMPRGPAQPIGPRTGDEKEKVLAAADQAPVATRNADGSVSVTGDNHEVTRTNGRLRRARGEATDAFPPTIAERARANPD